MSPKGIKPQYLLKWLTAIFVVIIIICLIFFLRSPKEDPLKEATKGMDTVGHRWLTWNILLKDGTNYPARSAAVQTVEDYINNYLKGVNSNYKAKFQVFYCPCDSLLYNLAAVPLGGSGEALIPSPPPPPPPGASGDVQFVSNNNRMVDSEDSALDTATVKNKLILANAKVNNEQILAVIDTGIDTTNFSPGIRELIWTDPGGNTIFNVIGSNSSLFNDDHIGKHGTVVTALVLQALKDKIFPEAINDFFVYPKLMILKALDKHKEGTTFSVSCALSYAIQHKAAVVNASLGYYETDQKVDSVFRHYIDLCSRARTAPILVFAAAGNLPGSHNVGICNSGKANLLNNGRMFYPACFSREFTNVISVTSLTNTHESCFFQNYSPVYVSLGVIQKNQNNCCHFSVPFANGEGTSFATPIACGTAMAFLLTSRSINDFIGSVSIENSNPLATKNGNYITY